MKTLRKYKESNGLTTAELAQMFGVSRVMVTLYLSGKKRPKYKRMLLIQKITGGDVKVDSWK